MIVWTFLVVGARKCRRNGRLFARKIHDPCLRLATLRQAKLRSAQSLSTSISTSEASRDG